MAFTRKKKIASGLFVLTALAGYGVYQAVFAVQGQGVLAQAPMNIEARVPPAFIMALDDSGSMIWEVLNNTRDGVFAWNRGNKSFYNGATPYGYSNGNLYYYQFMYPGRDSGAGVPPLDAFGFARSASSNPAYFDPSQDYATWKNYDGSDYYKPASPFSVVKVDPRSNGSNLTFDLSSDVKNAGNGYRFTLYAGMVLPKGTRISGGNCGLSPAKPMAEADGWSTLTANSTITNNGCTLGVQYFPATFYLEDASMLPAGYGYKASAVTVVPASSMGINKTLYKYQIKLENFDSSTQYVAAMQNFANWFSMYRTRREALIGSMTNAMLGGNQSMRVGWFTINNRQNVSMYDISKDAERKLLYQNFYSITATGSTPTRKAVEYLGQQFQRNSGNGLPIQYSCQKNAGMLFTDGYINDGNSFSYGSVDSDMGSPFADGYLNTMADISAYFYKNNLRTDLQVGRVPVPQQCSTLDHASKEWKQLDCNSNLHMNFYGITLGSKGKIYEVDANMTNDPYTYPPTWEAAQDLTPQAVDEMWHATLNTRGEMVNAKSPVAITEAMRRILMSVSQGASPSGSISATGARVGANSFSVSPFYEATNNGTDWYGKLTAQTVTSNSITGVVSYAQLWEASAMLPASAARNVWFGRYAGASAQALRFSSSNVALADLCTEPTPSLSVCSAALIGQRLKVGGSTGTPITATQAVSYLLGDQSLESDTLRKRTTRLGDIVNSAPVVAAPTDDYGYRSMAGATAGSYDPYNYAAYLTTKQSRPRVVFAGANDGMLHAFDGATGTERFGYIPTTALGHMGNLLFPYNAADKNNQVFQHRYFVDGQMTVSDVYAGGAWKTVLVGAAGAGGRGVFGLDVSSPATFTGANVLWEVNDRSSNATIADNIGYVLGKPVIVPVKTTGGTVAWKAIFGNGYNSNGGKAVLFVVDVGTGAVQAIQANESGAPAGSNGLGSIVVVDSWSGTGLTSSGRDGYADTVYAADQKGAIWKFDLRAATPANQTVPVFVTNTDSSGLRQPILGGLAAAAAPSGGVMVFFGTGSFSFEGDATDTTVQSLYGVQDRPGRTATLTRANLTAQTIGTTSADTRATSMNPLASGKLGWYMDLPAGERVVGNPRIESGILFIPTYLPDVSGTTGCASNGSNWLYGLDALSGAAGLMGVRVGSPTGDSKPSGSGAIKLETGGSAPVTDTAAFVSPRIKPLSATATATEVNNAIAAQCSMVVQAPGAQPLYVPRACGRQSWRQIK